MYGLKKEASRLGMKGPSMVKNPRPADSTHGNCVVCGKFQEELWDERCREEECQTKLIKMCLDRGHGMFSKLDDGSTFTIIQTDSAITERAEQFSEVYQAQEESTYTDDCSCGRALKMPRKDKCATCYREANTARLRGRKPRQRNNRAKITGNKIKGLDKIKLG